MRLGIQFLIALWSLSCCVPGAIGPDEDAAIHDGSSRDSPSGVDGSLPGDAFDGDAWGDDGGGDGDIGCDIIVQIPVEVTDDQTLAPQRCVAFIDTGKLDIQSNATVTIDGPVVAGSHQIFFGEGNVIIERALPQWFGATGDGLTNDTQTLQKTVDSAHVTVLATGVFLTDGLVMSEGRQIEGSQGILRSTPAENTLILMRSNCSLTGLTVDGDAAAYMGVVVDNNAQHVLIENTTIEHLRGPEMPDDPEEEVPHGAYGIRIMPGAVDVRILNSTIRDIRGGSDGEVGNSVGANRGILIGRVDDVLIEGCIISDIGDFEDGDAIHVQSGSNAYSGVTIRNNSFLDFEKRAIKLQSSGSIVVNNFIKSDFNGVSPIGDRQYPHAGIELWGTDHLILDNEIYLLRSNHGICTSGTQITFSGNTVENDKANLYTNTVAALFAINGDYLTVSDNILSGQRLGFGTYTYVRNSTIQDNTFSHSNIHIAQDILDEPTNTLSGNVFD